MSNHTEIPETNEFWSVPSKGKKPGWVHVVVFVILIVLGIVLGSFSSASFKITEEINPNRPAYGINYFWMGIVVQQVGSIWFGAWGVLAGMIFPIFSNVVTQASVLISIAYLPANFLQSFLPAFVFRRCKLDPRLNTTTDYLYLFLAMLFSSLIGALWSVFILVVVIGQLERSEALINFFGWFGGNLIAGVIFNFILLKALTQYISNTRAFVKRWWV